MEDPEGALADGQELDQLPRVEQDVNQPEAAANTTIRILGGLSLNVLSVMSTSNQMNAGLQRGFRGNICRCGTYVRIREGIKHAARS